MSTIIRCENLTKRYGSTRAINELTIELDDGDPIALIGPNGAGKTTLISLICGFIQPSQGNLSILGHKPGSTALSGQLAALPQDALLDPRLSVGRQLRFLARLQGMSSREAKAEVARVLETVDMQDSSGSRPMLIPLPLPHKVTT